VCGRAFRFSQPCKRGFGFDVTRISLSASELVRGHVHEEKVLRRRVKMRSNGICNAVRRLSRYGIPIPPILHPPFSTIIPLQPSVPRKWMDKRRRLAIDKIRDRPPITQLENSPIFFSFPFFFFFIYLAPYFYFPFSRLPSN